MHGLIRDRLEELLSAGATPPDLAEHLATCRECAAEIESIQAQSALFSTLRVPGELEPGAGFYARVIQRIEESAPLSIWSVFAESSFGKWLVYASLAVALILGVWMVGAEREDGHLGSSSPVIAHAPNTVPVTGDQAHQRDVVLVNLASYSQPAK